MFAFPETLRFTCSTCGDCCRSTNVPLGPGERERLEALDWKGKEARLEGGAQVVKLRKPAGPVRHRLAREADGACSYLGDDGRCLIHRHFGGPSKPLACRLYPFSFQPVGERVAVDVALSCRAVAEGRGQPLAAQESQWSALLAGARVPERRHRLTRKVRVSGALLWELEHHLLDFLHDDSLDVLQRVRCCLEFARLATTGDPATDAAATLRQVMARALPDQVRAREPDGELDKTQRAVFWQWLFLATNPPPPNFDLLSSKELRTEQLHRARVGGRHGDGEQRPWLEDRELSVTYAEIASVAVDHLRTDPDGQLGRFFAAKIIGQRFLVSGDGEMPFVEAVPKLFLWHPMAAWTAKAFAAERGAEAVGAEDVRRALRLLDRSLGQLTTASLPKPQARACDFVMLETDVVVGAAREILAAD